MGGSIPSLPTRIRRKASPRLSGICGSDAAKGNALQLPAWVTRSIQASPIGLRKEVGR